MIQYAGILPTSTTGQPSTREHPSRFASTSDITALSNKTTELMCLGLAGSTRRTYLTGQQRFLDFCYWSRCLNENGSPLPASEWMLMTFAAHLSSTLKADSIKVYLAGVWSLHLEHGLANPLNNYLRLERVLKGIKRTQGTSTRQRLPVTFTVLEGFSSLLDLNMYDDALIWAACCTAFYGFLRCGGFTTSSNKFDA